MVGGASKFLEYYSRGDNKIKATIKIANEMDDRHFCGSRLYKNSSTKFHIIQLPLGLESESFNH